MGWLTGSPGVWLLLALAIYGLISVIGLVIRRVEAGVASGNHGISLLVLIQNQEEQIEGFLRPLTKRLLARPSPKVGELILVDLASTDGTALILERLACEEPGLRVVQFSVDQSVTACESALFLCRNSVAMLIDLRGRVNTGAILHELAHIW